MKPLKKKELNSNLTKPSSQSFYGTAGYRLDTLDLNNVLCRASIIAYIRSSTFAGKYIGLYITASHNPVEYNGIKIIDFNGKMLDSSWEMAADELVNCADRDFYSTVNKIFRTNSNCTNYQDSIYGNVIIGRDTRESGIKLTENISEVLKGFRCNVMDYGVVTCPEMHYLIRKSNESGEMVDKDVYINHIYNLFTKLNRKKSIGCKIGIDTANGVSKYKIDQLNSMNPELKLEVLNEENGILNKECGADYIKTKGVLPKFNIGENNLIASFDGDVDRLIFANKNAKLYDGDSQAVFLAFYIKKILDKVKLDYSIGIVLSMYSNRGAIEYLKNNGFLVEFAQTGVKNFVAQAKKYDIGIYFEPNGHGSVMFSKKFLKELETNDCSDTQHIKTLTELFDPSVGDALANFMFFYAVLTPDEFFHNYKEYAVRFLVVKIKDKNVIKVDEKYNVTEPFIQKAINQVVSLYKGRGFVRPSGTENIVRVFAECLEQDQADELSLKIAQIVYDSCDGVGPYPEISYVD